MTILPNDVLLDFLLSKTKSPATGSRPNSYREKENNTKCKLYANNVFLQLNYKLHNYKEIIIKGKTRRSQRHIRVKTHKFLQVSKQVVTSVFTSCQRIVFALLVQVCHDKLATSCQQLVTSLLQVW